MPTGPAPTMTTSDIGVVAAIMGGMFAEENVIGEDGSVAGVYGTYGEADENGGVIWCC